MPRFETHRFGRRNHIRNQRIQWTLPQHKRKGIRRPSQTEDKKSVAVESSDNVNLPGFYFDPDKKRYFRILPGNNNFNPLTTSDIRQREQARAPSKVKEHKTLKSTGCSKFGLSHSLAYRQIGATHMSIMNTEIMSKKLRNLKLSHSFEMQAGQEDHPTESCEYLVGSPDYGYVVGSWRLERGGSALQAAIFSTEASSYTDEGTTKSQLECKSEPGTFKMCASELVNIYFNQKVYDICAIDLSEKLHYILCSAVSFADPNAPYSTVSLQPICKVSEQINRCFGEYPFCQTMEFPQSVAWSCAWTKATKSIAFGIDEHCFVKQLEQGECKEVYTNKERPYSVIFNGVGNCLFTGTHRGHLLCSDFREDCKNRVSFSLELGRGISYLKLLDDDLTLIASGYDGNLVQVDLRQKRSVFKYEGHVNDFGKLPFSVDECTNILCCTGKDRRTRFWNLRQGQLLSDEALTTACGNTEAQTWFSSQWCKNKGGTTKMAVIAACNKRMCAYE